MQNKKGLKNKIFLPGHNSVKWNDPRNFFRVSSVILDVKNM